MFIYISISKPSTYLFKLMYKQVQSELAQPKKHFQKVRQSLLFYKKYIYLYKYIYTQINIFICIYVYIVKYRYIYRNIHKQKYLYIFI